MNHRHLGLSCAALILFGASSTFAQQTAPNAPPAAKPGDKAAEAPKEAEKKIPPVPEDKVVQSKHSARIGGQEIKYTATAGMLVMKDEEGKPKASVFYVAYTRDDVTDLSQRPVMFTFNGGPGSASVWLHLGAFGPRRVEMGDAGSCCRLLINWWTTSRRCWMSPTLFLSIQSRRAIAGPRRVNRRISFTGFRKTCGPSAISSGCMRRATSGGPRRNFLRAKATGRRAPPGFPDICNNAMECI